jgi:CheY-like chemotaxis protein
VLVVDDDVAVLRMISLMLRSEGLSVLAAQVGQDGLAALQVSQPDLIELDLAMPSIDERAFYRLGRLGGYEGSIIICSAFGAEVAQPELGAKASSPSLST